MTAMSPIRSDSHVQRLWVATRRFRPVLVLDVFMFAFFSLTSKYFLTSANLTNLLTDISITWLIALGMTFVILAGGFDLSAGAVATVTSIALATLLVNGVPGWLAILLTILAGIVLGGVLNGLLVGRLKLSVFVVTLASMTALTGVAVLWTGSSTLPVTDDAVRFIVATRLGGIPVVVWLMLLSFVAFVIVQDRTQFGRNIYAVGGSRKAAELSGIRTDRVLFLVYAVLGGMAAIGGVIAAGRIGGAAPQVDHAIALQAIAAVLIGGASLSGGAGSVWGTFFGMLFVGLLQNGLSLMGVDVAWQQVITGVILVAAVLADQLRGPRFRKRPRSST